MGAKQDAYLELRSVIEEFGLAPSTVGREIASDPGLLTRLADEHTDIQTKTLDNVWRFIYYQRGQLDLDLDLDLNLEKDLENETST
jgi:hypothetical protein